MRKLTKGAVAAVLAAGLAAGATACDMGSNSKPPARAQEDHTTNSNYSRLVANQPAHTGSYSPTRATKNFWIDTWMHDPNKLSYVYLQNANGQYGYFVLKGLPVSYCTSLVPPTQDRNVSLNPNDAVVQDPAPSIDGAFGSGKDCSTKYGTDAVTGAYVEFTVGQNQSYFLYDRPLDLPQFKSAQPMGPSTIEAAKKIK